MYPLKGLRFADVLVWIIGSYHVIRINHGWDRRCNRWHSLEQRMKDKLTLVDSIITSVCPNSSIVPVQVFEEVRNSLASMPERTLRDIASLVLRRQGPTYLTLLRQLNPEQPVIQLQLAA